MKQIICFIWICFFWLTMTRAQDLAAELFFNQDPGRGNGVHVNLSSGETVDEVFTQAAGNLDPGIHRVFLRLRENHVWSHYSFLGNVQVTLTSQADLSGGIYFFNEIPANEGLVSHEFEPTDQVNATFDLSTAGLSEGRHNLYYRLTNGKAWSHYYQVSFKVSEQSADIPELVLLEYSVEGVAKVDWKTIPIGPVAVVDGDYDLSMEGVPSGSHTMLVKLSDAGQVFSHLATFEIRVCGGFETFIDMRWDALRGNASIEADGWQWLLNGDTIPDATQQEYIPLENGLYRVIVYYDGCADVSDEVNYTQVSTEKIAGAGTRIYPNPARDQVRILSASEIKQISITDITGRVRLIQTLSEKEIEVSLHDFASGVYFIRVETNTGIYTERLVVQP